MAETDCTFGSLHVKVREFKQSALNAPRNACKTLGFTVISGPYWSEAGSVRPVSGVRSGTPHAPFFLARQEQPQLVTSIQQKLARSYEPECTSLGGSKE
eukprot:280919-Hanusia_phi.AAC.2